MKRYIRVDMEYETDECEVEHSFSITDNIKGILRYSPFPIKVIFTRDTPNKSELSNKVFNRD